MPNRNYGKLGEDAKIIYAPIEVKIENTYYPAPTAEQYAECGYLPIDSTKPEKLGVYFISTEYGDLVGGRIVRRYEEHAITPPPTVYIVEEIIYQLIAAQKLQPTKSVVGDYWELLTMRERIDDTNPYWAEAFPQVCAGLIAAGVFASQDEIDAMLAKCREGYEDEDKSDFEAKHGFKPTMDYYKPDCEDNGEVTA